MKIQQIVNELHTDFDTTKKVLDYIVKSEITASEDIKIVKVPVTTEVFHVDPPDSDVLPWQCVHCGNSLIFDKGHTTKCTDCKALYAYCQCDQIYELEGSLAEGFLCPKCQGVWEFNQDQSSSKAIPLLGVAAVGVLGIIIAAAAGGKGRDGKEKGRNQLAACTC